MNVKRSVDTPQDSNTTVDTSVDTPQDSNIALAGLNHFARRKIKVMERRYKRRYLRKLEREAKVGQNQSELKSSNQE